MTLIFVNKWVTDDFFPTIGRALLRQDVCRICQSFYFKHRLTIGLCIGECTLPRKRRIMQETIVRKKKLVQGYQKDWMLLRRTHPGGRKLTGEWEEYDMNRVEEERHVLYSFADDRDDWSRPVLLSVDLLKYHIEQSICDTQEEIDIGEGIYRIEMKDRWTLIMIANGYCHSELTYYESIPYGRFSMLKSYRSDYGYYGPTQYKRFIQRMAHWGIRQYFATFFRFCNIIGSCN